MARPMLSGVYNDASFFRTEHVPNAIKCIGLYKLNSTCSVVLNG
jgi:hypothetical protein